MPLRGIRLWAAFAVIGFALAAGITLTLQSGKGGSGSGSASAGSPSDAIARAAYVTNSQAGFKFTINVNVTAAGRSVAMTGNGAFAPPGRGTIQFSMGPVSFTEIIAYPEVYMQMPASASIAPTPWVKVNEAVMMRSVGMSNPLSSAGDPSMMLEYLKSAGQVTRVGTDNVDGVSTTRYHVLLDLNRWAATLPANFRGAASTAVQLLKKATGQSTLPVDVWIDQASRLRRLEMQLSMSTPTGAGSMTMVMNLFDYGVRPTITLPPPSQVTDITAKMSASAAGAFGQTG
jgi:hypothetical protein